jgi:hypothetical protein
MVAGCFAIALNFGGAPEIITDCVDGGRGDPPKSPVVQGRAVNCCVVQFTRTVRRSMA